MATGQRRPSGRVEQVAKRVEAYPVSTSLPASVPSSRRYTGEGVLASASRMIPAWPVLGLNQAMPELVVPEWGKTSKPSDSADVLKRSSKQTKPASAAMPPRHSRAAESW